MKKGLLLGVILGFVIALIAVAADRYFLHKTNRSPVVAVAAPSPKPPPGVSQPPALMTGGEWQKYRSARETALQANPALQTEYNAILKKMDSQQVLFDAAMLKADPKLGPVLAKLETLRAQNSVTHSPASGNTTHPPVANLLPEEWQELRTARSKAMQAKSEFMDNERQLAARMNAYEDALDAAMLKAHPELAPILAKFEAGRHLLNVATNSSHSK